MKLIPSLRSSLLALVATVVLAGSAFAGDLRVAFRDGSEGNARLMSTLKVRDGGDLAALFIIAALASAADYDMHLVHMEVTNQSDEVMLLEPDQFQVAADGKRYALSNFLSVSGTPAQAQKLMLLLPNQRKAIYGVYAAPNSVAAQVRAGYANLYIPSH